MKIASITKICAATAGYHHGGLLVVGQHEPSPEKRTVGGAALGGVAGAVITNSGILGTVGGAAIGGVIGDQVGGSADAAAAFRPPMKKRPARCPRFTAGRRVTALVARGRELAIRRRASRRWARGLALWHLDLHLRTSSVSWRSRCTLMSSGLILTYRRSRR